MIVDDKFKSRLLETIPVGIVCVDMERRIQWANDICQQIVDMPLEQLVGLHCHDALDFTGSGSKCPVCRVFDGEVNQSAELKVSSRSDGVRYYAVRAVCLRDDAQNMIGAVAELNEITEIKAIERALQKSDARLREAQQLAHIGAWELDLQHNALYWSDEIYNIFEIDPGEFDATYEAFLAVIHPDDRALVNDTYSKSVIDKKNYEIAHRLLMPDGRVKYVHERGKTFYSDLGVPLRSIGTVWDITDRKLQEEENLKLQQRYHQAQKLETVGRLAGGIAHDFNNMLSVILGRTDLLLEPGGGCDANRESLLEIQNAAERSADLVHQLLAFARRQTAKPVYLNINNTVENMMKMLHRLIGEDIDLDWIPDTDLGTVRIDPSQMEQILVNLCVNARDAIEGIGKVTIETHNTTFDEEYCRNNPEFIPGNYVMLAVSDTGCGMSPEVRAQVFEPFFTTKKAGQGTGLGLATVFGIAKQNNGFVNVYSEPGEGTTFKIYLQRHTSEADSLNTPQDVAIPTGNGELILLVEDEDMVLQILKTILEKLNYRILAAHSPNEAIEQVRQNSSGEIRLMITDVIMPEMNGANLAKIIEGMLPGIQTLYTSAYTENVVCRHGVLKEGVDFLQKPALKEELALKVHELLNR